MSTDFELHFLIKKFWVKWIFVAESPTEILDLKIPYWIRWNHRELFQMKKPLSSDNVDLWSKRTDESKGSATFVLGDIGYYLPECIFHRLVSVSQPRRRLTRILLMHILRYSEAKLGICHRGEASLQLSCSFLCCG